jgi:hypothetical protein
MGSPKLALTVAERGTPVAPGAGDFAVTIGAAETAEGKFVKARNPIVNSISNQHWQNLPGKNEESALIFFPPVGFQTAVIGNQHCPEID